MMNQQKTQEKSISERFPAEWGQLNRNQRRFVIAMLESPNKKAAAEAIGIAPDTAYRWNGEVDEIIAMIEADRHAAALGILLSQSPKAAAIKTSGLDSDNETVRQSAATEILDRILGKPTQRNEHTGNEGGPIPITFIDYGLDDEPD